MARVYNFSAGPSMLPEPVLKKAAAELLNIRDQRPVGHGDEPPVAGV